MDVLNYGIRLIILTFFLAIVAFGQECTGWQYLLDTDPSHPKGLSGDTNAAYGIFAFRGHANLTLEGELPNARFMSIDTFNLKKQYTKDALIDYQIPTKDGKHFTLQIPGDLQMYEGPWISGILYRIFSPNNGGKVTEDWFPKIYSDECPTPVAIPWYFHFPQFFGFWVPRKETFTFLAGNIAWGPNPAIPRYYYQYTKMVKGEDVATIKIHPIKKVRYWSICAQNFAKNETLGCVPDWMAVKDNNGDVVVTFGGPKTVNHIDDNRGPRQKVVGFVYRNILPQEDITLPSGYLSTTP